MKPVIIASAVVLAFIAVGLALFFSLNGVSSKGSGHAAYDSDRVAYMAQRIQELPTSLRESSEDTPTVLSSPPQPLQSSPPLIVRSEPLWEGSCDYKRGYRDGLREGQEKGWPRFEFSTKKFPWPFVLAVALGALLCSMVVGLLRLIWNCVSFHAPRRPPEKSFVRVGGKYCYARRLTTLALCLTLAAGCAKHNITEDDPPVPMPPLKPSPAQRVESQGVPLKQGTTITVEDPSPSRLTSGPCAGEPAELGDLLNMKSQFSVNDTAVKQMRPSAIREAAHMVTLQTAIAWRYGKLLDAVYQHGSIMDMAFNFSPLVMTQGDALILPPVLTRSGASMRIEDDDTATTSATSYEMLQKAKYISVVPHWRTYLMAEGFPQPERPNPAILPKNSRERDIWRAAVRESWDQGVDEADQLFTDNVSRLARDYRGVMLYHLLTAQDLLSRVRTADADLGIKVSSGGSRLNIGQKVYRITAPSAFAVPGSKAAPQKKSKKRR